MERHINPLKNSFEILLQQIASNYHHFLLSCEKLGLFIAQEIPSTSTALQTSKYDVRLNFPSKQTSVTGL